ncbi:PIN domain-containing protein [Candidatus Poribacteria bacterium]|nr:PIN domain-containing protein [Candidatus Poribacteria bacterium]
MKLNYVLDACAIIAFLRDEKGADVVMSLLLKENCMAHAINLCEVYYDCLLRGDNESTANELIADLKSLDLIFREDMDEQFWKMVALYKARIRKSSLNVPLADCFVLSLAEREKATIVTSDHHEFDLILKNGFCPGTVNFIR